MRAFGKSKKIQLSYYILKMPKEWMFSSVFYVILSDSFYKKELT